MSQGSQVQLLVVFYGLGLWLQVGQEVFCCSQMCCGELHVLIILDLSVSCRAYLESNLFAVGNDTTFLMDIRDRLLRDM